MSKKTGLVAENQNKVKQTQGWRINTNDQTIWQIHVRSWAAYKGREAQVKSIALVI